MLRKNHVGEKDSARLVVLIAPATKTRLVWFLLSHQEVASDIFDQKNRQSRTQPPYKLVAAEVSIIATNSSQVTLQNER